MENEKPATSFSEVEFHVSAEYKHEINKYPKGWAENTFRYISTLEINLIITRENLSTFISADEKHLFEVFLFSYKQKIINWISAAVQQTYVISCYE